MSRGGVVRIAPRVPVLCLGSSAHAYPTSPNTTPTADLVAARTARIGVESDGDPTPFPDGAVLQVCTQFGTPDCPEVGFDLADASFGAEHQLDGKWFAVPEPERAPAVAIGRPNMTGSGVLSGGCAMLAKDVGGIRAHGGFVHSDIGDGFGGLAYSARNNIHGGADFVRLNFCGEGAW